MLLRLIAIASFATSCMTYDSKIEQYDFTYQGKESLSENQEFSKFTQDDKFCNNNAAKVYVEARNENACDTDKFVGCMKSRGWTADLR